MKWLSALLCAAALVSCVSIPRAPAPPSPPVVLDDAELSADRAVAFAMANSPRLQATLAELGIARADLWQASVVRNPLFEAEIRFPRDPYRPYELRVAQTLIDLLQLRRRRAIGRAAFDATQVRIAADVARFGADVRARHAELVAATQRLALSRDSLEAANASADLARRQHDAGNITDLDVENEQSVADEAKLQLARDEQHLAAARESFIRILGIRDANAALKLPQSLAPLPAKEADDAATQRLDLELARRNAGIAKQLVAPARLAAIGDVIVDVHFQRDAIGAHTVGPGIEVPIPIFNSGAAARSRAEAEYVRAAQIVNALVAESESQLRAAHANVNSARARVELVRDVVIPRRERIVELTKLQLNAMAVSPFQLLQAKRNEIAARRDLVDVQLDYWLARNDLDRALNGVASSEGAR